jgi:hypothetical protein
MVTDKALAATLLEDAHAALVDAGVVPERRARSLQACAATSQRRRSISLTMGRRLDDEILWNDDFFDDNIVSGDATTRAEGG